MVCCSVFQMVRYVFMDTTVLFISELVKVNFFINVCSLTENWSLAEIKKGKKFEKAKDVQKGNYERKEI